MCVLKHREILSLLDRIKISGRCARAEAIQMRNVSDRCAFARFGVVALVCLNPDFTHGVKKYLGHFWNALELANRHGATFSIVIT